MDQTLNSSQTPASTPNPPGADALGRAHLVLGALILVVCACGIVGNSMVVWLLSFCVQRAPFCVYVLHLAVADLLFLLCATFTVSLEVASLATRWWKAYEVMQRVEYFAYTCSLSLLTAISTQRCLSVLFPIWYRCHRPRHLSTTVCTLLWGLSLLMNTVSSFFCIKSGHPDEKQCLMVDSTSRCLILGIFIPVMTLSSVTLFVRVQRSPPQRRRRPMRLYVVILVSVLVFLLCAVPFAFNPILLSWGHLKGQVVLLYRHISLLSTSVSSSANPVIYFAVGRRRSRRGLREPLGAVLRTALQEEPELEERETPSTGTNELGV
ncbi:mas-related G-protein coupled receptor member D [Equus asinus]|uniref:mas-related G-protein coupled receptor member D n=1 Tax=Equus asinus TaxID=9793 RepID=UPI001D04AFB7|nr:LOW QUALITY PROTEIN: mas-related G-protein coupled receptor member D [Equus asinus]